MKIISLLIISFLISVSCFSQRQDSTIEDQVFTISEYYTLDPKEITKKPFYAPIDQDTTTRQNTVRFTLEEQSLFFPYVPLGTTPLAYHMQESQDTFLHFIKAGYGTKQKGLLEAGFVLNKANPLNINLHYDHIKGKERFQQSSNFYVDGSHRFLIGEDAGLSSRLTIMNASHPLFGHPVDTTFADSDIKNSWNQVEAEVKYDKDIRLNSFYLSPQAYVSFLSNSFSASEFDLRIDANGKWRINKDFSIPVNPFLRSQNVNSQGSLVVNNIFGVQSGVEYNPNNLNFKANIELNNLPDIFYGSFLMAYNISPNTTSLMLSIGKDYRQNTYTEFYRQNKYLKYFQSPLNSTFSYIDLGLELSGNPILEAKIHAGYKSTKNLSYFQFTSDSIYSNYYEVHYAPTSINQIYFNLNTRLVIAQSNILYADVIYNGYNNDDLIKYNLYNLPQFEAKAGILIPIKKIYKIGARVNFMSSRTDKVEAQKKNLPSLFNLGMSGEARLRKNLFLWLDVDNFFNSALIQYYLYPSVGTTVQAGILYRFK